MFDDGTATALQRDTSSHREPGSPRCDACGARNPAGYHYCVECGARSEATLAYGAVVHLTLAAAWFGGAPVTAVSTPSPRDAAACTGVSTHDGSAEHDAPANDAIGAAVHSPSVVGGPALDTERRAMDMAWVQMIDAVAASPAELAWEALAGEDITAVWSASDSLARTAVAAGPCAAVLIELAADGYPGQGTPSAVHFISRGGSLDVGRDCAGPGAEDPYLDAWHARLISSAAGLMLHDPGTRGGVWMRLHGPRWLRDGDRFRLGEQFLCFDAVDGVGDRGRRGAEERGRIQQVDDERRVGLALAICGPTVLGRAGTDVVLMDDPYVSCAHCRLLPDGDGVQLSDLGSSNGTWVRLRCGDVIPFGALIAIGQRMYRVDSAER